MQILKQVVMVNVIGLGYIGLPTALMLAAHGVQVVGTDYDGKRVETLSQGLTTFKEKGLKPLFQEAQAKGIRFSTEYQHTDMYIVSVPTPYDKESKKIDAHYVQEAVRSVLQVCKRGTIIVIESTISPGTIDTQIRPLIQEAGLRMNEDIFLVHAPERIIPGNMIYELVNNNRTIGADTPEVAQKVKQLYASFCRGEIVTTDVRTAEMTKVVENTYRAVNIAFANELSRICHYDNMDVHEIIRICNMHPRVNIMNPGPGVGGHCIPVDPWFLVGDYPQLTQVIGASMRVNQSQPDFLLQLIEQQMADMGISDYSRVGLYGMTYKENVDDYRESPTLQVLASQEHPFAKFFKCYDPYLEDKMIADTQYADFDEFLAAVDLVVLMVKHEHIQQHWDKLKDKAIFDCYGICPLPNTYRL